MGLQLASVCVIEEGDEGTGGVLPKLVWRRLSGEAVEIRGWWEVIILKVIVQICTQTLNSML